MKRLALLFLALAGCNCATPATSGPRLALSDDVKLDHDQVLACVYVQKRAAMVCMTIDEFRTRLEAAEGKDVENL